MFISRIDYERCLKEGSFVDEIVQIEREITSTCFQSGDIQTYPRTEQIMTRFNNGGNVRLCQGKVIRDDKVEGGVKIFQFTKRTINETAKVCPDKYSVYFEKEIRPIIQRSNNLIRRDNPDVAFY